MRPAPLTEQETAETEAQMLAGLKDKDKDFRLVCAMGLCSTGKSQHIKSVTAIVDKIVWEEVSDLAASLYLFGEPAVPFLVPLVHSGKKSTAACAMRALGKIGGNEAAEALIIQLLSLPTKSEPTEALVSMRTAAVPFLTPLLKNIKADVREMAAFALGKIGDEGSLAVLESMAQNDKSAKVQEVAEQAVKWILKEEVCMIDLRNTFGAIELKRR